MSESSLPADLSQWPNDPYVLFGLARSADATNAKRAYLKLIRVYKPEHEPEKFQKIRAAYEEIQARIAFHLQLGIPLDPSQPPSARPATNDESAGPFEAANSAAERADASAARPVPELPFLPLDEAWDWAVEGDPRLACQRLMELAADEKSGAAHARLYWLATLFPEASPRRPCEWLISGLEQTHLLGPLRELFRREVMANPREGLRPECDVLLSVSTQSGPLLDLIDFRWLAAGRVGDIEVILRDLNALRPRVAPLDDETWARLLLSAIDQLAWAEPTRYGRKYEELCHEVDSMNQIHVALADQLHRLDMLRAIEEGWRRLTYSLDVPAAWHKAVPICWYETWEVTRKALFPIVSEIADAPVDGLGWFDEMRRISHSAAMVLGAAIERLRANEVTESDYRGDEDAQIAAVVEFARRPLVNYPLIRPELLKFCIAESIEPESTGKILDSVTFNGNPFAPWSWTDQLAEDGPLRYVYAACRLWQG